jgi:hypothetical protein
MFSFDPNPTRAKNAWASSTCLLYGAQKGGTERGHSGVDLVADGGHRKRGLIFVDLHKSERERALMGRCHGRSGSQNGSNRGCAYDKNNELGTTN